MSCILFSHSQMNFSYTVVVLYRKWFWHHKMFPHLCSCISWIVNYSICPSFYAINDLWMGMSWLHLSWVISSFKEKSLIKRRLGGSQSKWWVFLLSAYSCWSSKNIQSFSPPNIKLQMWRLWSCHMTWKLNPGPL